MPFLKEVDFDIPYVKNEDEIKQIMMENNLTENEATKKHYEDTWQDKRMQLRDECRSVCNLFAYEMGRVKIPLGRQILVECVKEKTAIKTIRDFTGVIAVEVLWDEEVYFKSSVPEKKKYLLEKLMEGLEIYCAQFDFDQSVFKEAYQKVIRLDYKNEYVWKQKKNRKRKLTGELFCVHEMEYFEAYLRIKQGDNILSEKKAIRTKGNEWAFYGCLGELKWITDEEFVLFDDDSKIVSKINI